jgi:hypothetical protein
METGAGGEMKRISCAVWLPVLALLTGLGSHALADSFDPFRWEVFYGSPYHGNDVAVDLVTDHNDDIIVTGTIESLPGNGWANDMVTLKYNRDDSLLWESRAVVSPRMPATAAAITCDDQNNTYVVGTCGYFWSVAWAMVVVKYRPNGDTAWIRRFPGEWFSIGKAVAVDAQHNVYAAGFSGIYPVQDDEDFLVVKCDSNGNEIWSRSVDGPAHRTDTLVGMCQDSSGNVIVTGITCDPGAPAMHDWLTVKFSPAGDSLWVRRWDGGEGQDDRPTGVTADAAGNVYVCGASNHPSTTGWDYQVVKYSPAGDILMRASYNNQVTDFNDVPAAFAVDGSQNVYVTGAINDTISGDVIDSACIATVKFGPAGGSPVWVRKYRGPLATDDVSYSTAMKLDKFGNVYVTGSTYNSVAQMLQQVTLKYDFRGNLKWSSIVGAAEEIDAHAHALALDSRGSVYVAGDDYVNGENLDYSLTRYAGPDVGVARVIAPRDTIRVNRAVTPSIMVKNYSPIPVTGIPVYMLIGATWLNTTIASLDAYESLQVNFESWSSRDAGNFPIVAYTSLTDDWENANDTAHGFVATVLPWVAKDTIPIGPKKKYVKDGGKLAYDDNLNLIYAVKGNNTPSFYSFGPTQTWVERESVPIGSGRRKVKKGAAMAYGGNNTVYLAKGNRTAELWAYNPSTGWVAKSNLPYVLKAGTAMAYVPNLGRLYVLPAENTRQLWYYDTSGAWHTELGNMPNGPKNKTCKDGTALAYDGSQYLYALKGKTSEFYAYDVMNNVWSTKDILPNSQQTGKKKTSGDGAAFAFAGGLLYAFKGNNTREFWCWSPAADTWTELDSMLGGVKKKKIKAGGSLVSVNGKVYALKGNGTNEFYLYNANIPNSFFDLPGQPGGQGLVAATVLKPGLRVAPNPFRGASVITYSLPRPGVVSMRLYDVTGRQEINLFTGRQRTGNYRLSLANPQLAAGVYFLKMRFDDGAGEQQLTTKVLIER